MVDYPHRIRLRGPWECEPLERLPGGGPVPAPRRMHLPCRWQESGLSGFTGRVRFRRRFGYPGQIDDYERVWLTLAGFEGRAEILLNGTQLGQADQGPVEFEVTRLLQERNCLEVIVESQSPQAGLWGEVALEIRCSAYLRGIQVACKPGNPHRLIVRGQVVGTADQTLELYVIADRHTVAYHTVEPSPKGTAFQVETDEMHSAPAKIRVELVNLSTIWYAMEAPIVSG